MMENTEGTLIVAGGGPGFSFAWNHHDDGRARHLRRLQRAGTTNACAVGFRAACDSAKPWLPVITNAGKKVQMIVPVVSPEARRHVSTLRRRLSLQHKRELQNPIRFRNGKAHPLQRTQRMGDPDFVAASKRAPPALISCQP